MKYSSAQFRQDWRYATGEEFATSDGQPFPYAQGGHLGWGDETAKLPSQNASTGCISTDGSRMAIAVDKTVYVYDTKSWETIAVLKAHLEQVTGVAFQRNNSNLLVTSSSEHSRWTGGKAVLETDAVIFVWRLDEHMLSAVQEAETVTAAVKAAATAAAQTLSEAGTFLLQTEVEELKNLISPSIEHVVTKNMAAGETSIHGRLQDSFGSNIFSPSGGSMVYLPGNSPTSNDIDKWDICICKTTDFAVPVLTLSGHTDGIMWVGWNEDESLFASIAWDSTVRVWNAISGEALNIFKTGVGVQNWTGGFSPDSRYLAATNGMGQIHVYKIMKTGPSNNPSEIASEEHWAYVESEDRGSWRRALAWHPNSKWLAVGSDRAAELILLDVEEKRLVQKRSLSVSATQVDREELRAVAKGYTGINQVAFADEGNKIIIWSYGDDSIEVLDVEKEQKWRFGRGGTDDIPGAEEWRDENGKVTSPGGSGMLVWEDGAKLMMASLDGDAIRVWSIDLEK